MAFHDSSCYNCQDAEDNGGPICHICWRYLDENERETIKVAWNRNVSQEVHGAGALLHYDIRGCWKNVSKANAERGDTRCKRHQGTCIDADRSRSPVHRRSDAPATSRQRSRMIQAIGKLRAGLEMMQKAIKEIDDVGAHQ